MRASFAVAAIACAAGCDSRATASDPVHAEQRSREYETCSASAQCQDDLRCFDHTCRRTLRSTIGDYYVAAGALSLDHGDLDGAVANFAQALSHYDAEKIAMPPDVDCAYGQALAAARAKHDNAERGARVLHRCVMAVPVGSKLRDQALASLATLGDSGLEPTLLGANKAAEQYLTHAPSRPASDKLTVTVAATPTPPGKSYALIPDKVAEADVHAALVACWEAYNAASHKDALTVIIGVKTSYIASDYEDEPGAYIVKLDPATALPPASPEAAADACVRQILEPAIKALKLTDAVNTKLAVSIK